MRGEQAIFNLKIKKKSGLSINPDIHHSKVFSSGQTNVSPAPRPLYIYLIYNFCAPPLYNFLATSLILNGLARFAVGKIRKAY